MLGVHLRVPQGKLKEIEARYQFQGGFDRCKAEVLCAWLQMNPSACWKELVAALSMMEEKTLATILETKYCPPCSTQNGDYQCGGRNSGTFEHSLPAGTETGDIKVNRDVLNQLVVLESDFSEMRGEMKETFRSQQQLCRLRDFLEDFLDDEEFCHCDSIERVFRLLKKDACVDVFNIHVLYCVAKSCKSDYVHDLLDQYQKKLDEFLRSTSLKEFEEVVRSRQHTTTTPSGQITLTLAGRWPDRTLKDLKGLVYDIFGVNAKMLVLISMRPGSIVVQWSASLSVLPRLKAKAEEATELLIASDVEELSIGGECIFKVCWI